MNDTMQLKTEFISMLDLLPVEGLKLLAEFMAFLRTKFKLPPQPLALQEQNQRDLELLNRHAERLNEEALDVLAYQIANCQFFTQLQPTK